MGFYIDQTCVCGRRGEARPARPSDGGREAKPQKPSDPFDSFMRLMGGHKPEKGEEEKS